MIEMRGQQSELAIETLRLDLPRVETRIKRFIKNYVNNCESEGMVLGLSGGLDSSTTAALAALSLGDKKVVDIAMPEEETYNATDIRHAELVAKKIRI
jgi:NAD+ synthase